MAGVNASREKGAEKSASEKNRGFLSETALDFGSVSTRISFAISPWGFPPNPKAGVAELVDARDSKSRSFGSAGSIPAAGIFSW